MKGIFVNENGGIRYAEAIVKGIKPVETRSKNMLSACVGERVAIIRTRRNKKPTIVGYADITASWWYSKEMMDNIRDYTLIPEGSKYDSTSRGKWCYWMSKAEECEPYEDKGRQCGHHALRQLIGFRNSGHRNANSISETHHEKAEEHKNGCSSQSGAHYTIFPPRTTPPHPIPTVLHHRPPPSDKP